MDRVKSVGEASGSAKALVKGIAVVNILAGHRAPMRLADIVARLDLPRGTVVRLLDALCDAQLIATDLSGRYRLGPRCAIWGAEFLSSLELREVASDAMVKLSQLSNETCHLGIRDGDSVVYVRKVESPHSLRMVSRVGGTNPLHSTGLGKALLAFLPVEDQEAYLARPLERRTPQTIVDPGVLATELERIRANGYAVDDIENEVGVRCIGAPLFDHLGELVGSISLAGPSMRMTWERVEQLKGPLLEAAQAISMSLGHNLSPTGTQVGN